MFTPLTTAALLVPAFLGTIPSLLPALAQQGAHPTAQWCHEDPANQFARGQRALAENDLSRAQEAFTAVLRCDPRSAAANANLGVVFIRRGNSTNAIRYFTKARQLDPKMNGVLLNLGLAYYRQGDYKRAIPEFERFLKAEPGSTQATHLLGLSYFSIAQYPQSAAALGPLWEMKNRDLSYLYTLGLAAERSGNQKIQEKAWAQLLKVGADSALLHMLIGKAYLNRTEHERAVPELQRAVALDPRLPFAHFNLGLAYQRNGEPEKAKAEFEQDIALEPEVAYNYDQLGTLLANTGDDAQAESNFRRALSLDGRLATAHFGLAKLYEKHKEFARALASATAAESLDPASPNIHYVRGRILQKLGRTAESKQEYAKAQQIMAANRQTPGAGLPEPEIHSGQAAPR